MGEGTFIQLLNLFNSLGIIEKGIEKIYHFLLINKRIDNLKEVCKNLDLSLKRGYKITSVLNDLGLIHIFDRPMKINLATPLIPLWQKIINDRIEKLKDVFQEEKMKCITSLEDFIKNYNLKSLEPTQEPVELLIFKIDNIDELFYPFLTNSQCKIAIGINYENPLITLIRKSPLEEISENLKSLLNSGMKKVQENLKNINIQIIFNNELIKELLNSKEFTIISEYIKSFDFELKNIEIRIIEEDFSNFSLTDNELIQPSFDPTNRLMGAYISRNLNIYQIFYNKFLELFEKAIPINEYINRHIDEISIDSLSDKQAFGLYLL
ncbi:MAG: hypothetical protein ACFFAN_05490 [Promethearchaeota archaeon]